MRGPTFLWLGDYVMIVNKDVTPGIVKKKNLSRPTEVLMLFINVWEMIGFLSIV